MNPFLRKLLAMNPLSPRTSSYLPLVATFLLGIAVALPGAGCASRSAAGRFIPATTESLAALHEVDLRLTRLVTGGHEVDVTTYPISLRFGDGGKISGRSSVNRYFEGFELGDEGALTWPGAGLGMTRMAGPAAAMQIESQFSQTLTATSQLLTTPDGARFQSADGTHVVEFQR